VDIYRGIVRAYDSANHKADVLLVGSMSRVVLGVPVATNIAAEYVTVGADCGVMLFGEGGSGVGVSGGGAVPPPRLDLDAWGPTLTVDEMVMGWQDHFFGDSLHSQYKSVTGGAGGVISLRDSHHGGVVRLRAYAGVGARAQLWLGDEAGSYDSLDADSGWLQLAKVRYDDLTSMIGMIGAVDSTTGLDRIWAGQQSGSWKILTRKAGVSTSFDTGVDIVYQQWYRIACDVYPTNGGRQVDLWVDGELLGSVDTNVPNVKITPWVYIYNSDAGDGKTMYLDYWGLFPRYL